MYAVTCVYDVVLYMGGLREGLYAFMTESTLLPES